MSQAPSPSHLENPFWRYSLAHYARPEVADCCLAYQDQQNFNVNLLLFCCWLGSVGSLLSSEALEQAKSHIQSWDMNAVQPIRKARRSISALLLETDTAINSSVDEILSELKRLELKAEQFVQAALFDWWQGEFGQDVIDHGLNKGMNKHSVLKMQVANLNLYLSSLNVGGVKEDSPLLWPIK